MRLGIPSPPFITDQTSTYTINEVSVFLKLIKIVSLNMIMLYTGHCILQQTREQQRVEVHAVVKVYS